MVREERSEGKGDRRDDEGGEMVREERSEGSDGEGVMVREERGEGKGDRRDGEGGEMVREERSEGSDGDGSDGEGEKSLPHDLPTPLHSTPHTRHEAGGRGRQVEEDGRVVEEDKWMRKLYVVEERWRKLNGEGEVEEVI
ncbi:hypothetical protein Pmani_030175 [Petrolisthes manimaculis]|uniref:Uncharacterized protein n=1 Tax=Petrolisthes manimaculis TaxID=1843537 RepID=A0AAE1TTR3_9EUCA|nr:hypothetical protein Pmani_030175 [Petrolisthes manimaculis]